MNASSPTPPKPVAPTVVARFKSTLARLIGANPVDKSGNSEPTPTATVAETIWSKEWCAKEPELAALAIEALQDRVGILEDYIKAKEPKPRKRLLSRNPEAVLLSSLMPGTRFKLLRTGETYFMPSPSGGCSWRNNSSSASPIVGCPCLRIASSQSALVA